MFYVDLGNPQNLNKLKCLSHERYKRRNKEKRKSNNRKSNTKTLKREKFKNKMIIKKSELKLIYSNWIKQNISITIKVNK